jgi:hypothetical protein
MSRYLITLRSTAERERAMRIVGAAPAGTRVEFKAVKRTTPQNDRMWAMLTDVAQQVKWHGVTLRPDDWKLIFLDALKRELRMVPNLDNTGFVNLGRSSSDLSKDEMGQLMELIAAWGAEHAVTFHDSEPSTSPVRAGGRADPPPDSHQPAIAHDRRRAAVREVA